MRLIRARFLIDTPVPTRHSRMTDETIKPEPIKYPPGGRVFRAVAISSVVTMGLATFQYLLYRFTGSMAIRADAVHSTSDLTALVFVFANLTRFSQRHPAVKRASGVAIACLILFAAGAVASKAAFGESPPPRNLTAAMVGTFIAIIVIYVTATYKIRVGREAGFEILEMEGKHSLTDMLSSVVVLFGVIGQKIGIPLDAPCAVVVTVLIGWMGLCVLHEAVLKGRDIGNLLLRWCTAARIRGVILIVAMLYLCSGVYLVREGKYAVVTMWGRHVDIRGPGLHYRLPKPFMNAQVVDTTEVKRVTIGVETTGKTESARFTGDQNLLYVALVISYVITDPAAFLFQRESPKSHLIAVCESAVTTIFSRNRIDDLLGRMRGELLEEAGNRINDTLTAANAPVRVITLSYLYTQPPPAVLPAFRQVAGAKEDRERYVNEAQTYAYRNAAWGRAEVVEIRQDAKAAGYRILRQMEAEVENNALFSKVKQKYPTGFGKTVEFDLQEPILSTGTKLFLQGDPSPLYLDIRKNGEAIP